MARVEYRAKLSSPHEEVKLSNHLVPSWRNERCAILVRFGRVVTKFLASTAQQRKIARRSGTINITNRAVQKAVNFGCPGSRGDLGALGRKPRPPTRGGKKPFRRRRRKRR